MKYMKLSSLLVLSLLLFAPGAWAALECEIGSSLQEIRMESMNESLNDITVTCTWGSTDIAVTAPANRAADAGGDTKATGTKFDLELDFNGDLSNADDSPPTLVLQDTGSAESDAAANALIDFVNDKGVRTPAPKGQVSGGSVFWPGVVVPTTWVPASGAATDPASGRRFMIKGIMIDANSVDDDRLEVTMVMTGVNTAALGGNVDTSHDDVRVARVKQALDLEFAEDQKAVKFNACDPGSDEIAIRLVEGYPKAWTSGNDILLVTSSGKITAKDQKPFDVIDRTEDDELTVSVTQKPSVDDSANLTVMLMPEAGVDVGESITITAMLLPARGQEESFGESAKLTVGTYAACKGDSLFFPFLTTRSGWDTGIVVVNDSKVAGSCSLNWGNKDLKEEEMAALSTIDVDAKGHTAFLVSMQRGADYNGSLGVTCSFSSATGYVFLSDATNGIGQGYLVLP